MCADIRFGLLVVVMGVEGEHQDYVALALAGDLAL